MPVPSVEMQQLARAFFLEAQRDFEDAKVLHAAKHQAAAITSCQHAVEKALKTIYILARNKRPPMTHLMLGEVDAIIPNLEESLASTADSLDQLFGTNSSERKLG